MANPRKRTPSPPFPGKGNRSVVRRPALAGLVIGFGAAFGLARLISSLLAGVNAHDSITFASAAAVLVLTALVACSIPALRAANVDPGKVLHYE